MKMLTDDETIEALSDLLYERLNELDSYKFKSGFVNGEIFAYKFCLVMSELDKIPKNARFASNAPKYYIEFSETKEELLERTIHEIVGKLRNLLTYPREEGYFMGERTAYVECLELLERWEKAAEYGLDFDIEKVFPLI